MGEVQPQGKKLIEVALPLEAINKTSAREKSIRHWNPRTLHLWWARRPFQREPDFGVTSVNYDFAELLVRAGVPV